MAQSHSVAHAADDLSQTSRSFDEGNPGPHHTPYSDARARANTAPADMSDGPEEDEEVKQAKALALAYKNNPNLSVDQAQKIGKSKLIPTRLAQAFQRSEDGSSVKRAFNRTRNVIKGSFSSNGEHGGSVRQRQATPRSPPLSPGGDGSLSPVDEDHLIQEATATPNLQSPPSSALGAPPRIRLTSLAWKRRGGVGKYSATRAWERRRIELRGHKLFYYKTESDEGDEEDSHSPSLPAPSGQEDTSEGVVVARRSSWFEQAFTSAAMSSEADPSTPRGEMDLIKEKAIVAATLGHSGSPSPFAISIKCRGETKWKLCFDHHKEQMEWLAALTDVTVQASVDVYNHLLLEAADPSLHIDGVSAVNLFPSTVSAPPGSHQRLWQCELYTISNERAGTGEDLEDAIGPADVMEELEAEEREGNMMEEGDTFTRPPVVSVTTLPSSSSSVSSIPEQNFWIAAAIVNGSLAIARASSTTLEGFWYIVALANLGLYLCTTKEGKTETVKVVTTTVATGSSVTQSKRRVASHKEGSARKGTPTSSSSKTPKGKGNTGETGFKPLAGTTTVKLKNPTDPPANAKGQLFAGWRCPSADILHVRSVGYSSLKKKQASPGELYDCTQVEVFESPSRYPDMAPRVKLPKIDFKDEGPKTWRTPDIFVISIALPTDPPKLGRSSSDGGGYTVTMYFTMRQETRDILRRVTAEGYDPSKEKPDDPTKSKVNAVRLLEEWCRRAPNDPGWFSRFKGTSKFLNPSRRK